MTKASLPSSRGGINFCSASFYAPAVYLESSSLFHPLVDRDKDTPGSSFNTSSDAATLAIALEQFDWQSPGWHWCPFAPLLSFLFHQQCLTSSSLLVSSLHTFSCPGTLSSGMSCTGDWLNGVPFLSWACIYKTRSFTACLLYWLEVSLHSHHYTSTEYCDIADLCGDNQVGCGSNGNHISRHISIQDVTFSAAQSVAIAPSKETPRVVPNSLARPADIFLPNWSRGCPVTFDVHVISPLHWQTLGELLPPQSMRSRWVLSASYLPNCQPVALWWLNLFPLWLKPWVVLQRTPSSPSAPLVKLLDRELPLLTLPLCFYCLFV